MNLKYFGQNDIQVVIKCTIKSCGTRMSYLKHFLEENL
jgi:hypothetical protein